MRKISLLLVTMLVLSGSFSVWAAPAFQVEKVLPAKTLLLASLTNGKQFCEQMRDLGMWKLFQDPQWQVFFKTIPAQYLQMAKQQSQMIEKRAGISLQQLHGAFAGQISLALADVKMGRGMPMPVVLLSWDLGKQKDVFARFFTKARQQLYAMMPNVQEKSIEIQGHKAIMLTTPLPIFMAYLKNTLLVCSDQALLGSILSGKANPDSLAKSVQYNTVKKQLLQGNEGTYIYLNLKDAKILGMPFLGRKAKQIQQGLQLTGLDALDAIAIGFSLRQGHATESIYFYTPKGRTGILKSIFPNIQVSNKLQAFLPKKLLAFSNGIFDLADLYHTSFDMMKKSSPWQHRFLMSQKKEMEDEFGINIDKALSYLGKEYLFSVGCSGGFIPDMVFQLTLKKPAKFRKIMNKFLTMVPKKYRYQVKWNGPDFTYFNFSTRRQPIPVAPTVAIVGNRLVITPFPSTFKNMCSQSNGRLPGDCVRYLDGRSHTIAEYLNLKGIVGPLYRTALPLIQGMIPRYRIPVEPALLPSGDLLEKYFSNIIFLALYDKEGALWEIHTPTGTFPLVIASAAIGYQVEKQKRARRRFRRRWHEKKSIEKIPAEKEKK